MENRPINKVEIFPFSISKFLSLVESLCGYKIPGKANRPEDQVEYIARYIKKLGDPTKSKFILVEEHYIDRHFMHEYSGYYSQCFVDRPNNVARIHAFEAEAFPLTIDDFLGKAYNELDDFQETLQSQYLGYVTIRPVSSVPIGRTVLLPLEDDEMRKYTCIVDYDVHILGLLLSIRGLAFQQQDKGVAACASVATWSTLQRLCKYNGFKAPTPTEVTLAAVKHVVGNARPFPSQGLIVDQILSAFVNFNFPPTVVKVDDCPKLFKLILHSYLLSGIPAVLILWKKGSQLKGHAVAVLGYRENDEIDMDFPQGGEDFRFRNLGYDEVYIHDDAIGPYAKGKLKITRKKLELIVPRKTPAGAEYEDLVWEVNSAIFPLYPKIRTSAKELREIAAQSFPQVLKTFNNEADNLSLKLSFSRCGDYLKKLYQSTERTSNKIDFIKKCSLSRYIGIVSWYYRDNHILDLLWDTTDTLREDQTHQHILGIVTHYKRSEIKIENIERFSTAFSSVPMG